ncbi:TPA: CopG family transcriptional regulator [candidate division WOR-3 bacterium]|jgi:putative iron-only hydrogenase system regulator|uniref:CopG family transcriptional regulator n=1 Tax=candidate division WOR-3 bacterium TaxID=2052148 RepID=A0A350HBW8_UNCW3|nr:CopG family transcriptional regulator [candidate division WOR-3 bacterium]
MDTRVGVVGIIVENRAESANAVNNILTDYGFIVRGRMGIPNLTENVCAISLIVEGTNEDIGAMTGRLGKIKGVKVSSTFIKKEIK